MTSVSRPLQRSARCRARRSDQRGILDKTSVEEDKRKNALSLTPAGQTLWTQCDTVLTELKHTLAEPFSPGEREAFIYLLNKFNAAFNDRARTTLEGTDS